MEERIEDYGLGKKPHKQGVITKVGIIGCGSMGQDIARLTSQNGLDVLFIDVSDERIKVVLSSISKKLDDAINHWGLTESEKKAILSRIKGSTDYKELKDCNIIIETVNSKKPGTNLEIRKEVFYKVEAVVPQDTVIASNTSTLMISDLANVLEFPERAIGIHFLSPVQDVKIVEVVRGVKTSEQTFEVAKKFAKIIGKLVVPVYESPGNISTRLIVTLINEACQVMMEGVASATCIDTTMKEGFGLQFGPLEMADRIGLDKVLKWMENLYHEFGDHKFLPSPILRRLVRSGFVGRRADMGFYKYEKGVLTGPNVSITQIK